MYPCLQQKSRKNVCQKVDAGKGAGLMVLEKMSHLALLQAVPPARGSRQRLPVEFPLEQTLGPRHSPASPVCIWDLIHCLSSRRVFAEPSSVPCAVPALGPTGNQAWSAPLGSHSRARPAPLHTSPAPLSPGHLWVSMAAVSQGKAPPTSMVPTVSLSVAL